MPLANGRYAVAPESIFDKSIPLQSKIVAWAVNQGVPTVLLVLILFGIYDSSPKMLEQIQRGYEQNAAQLRSVVEVNDRHIDRIMSQVEADRKTLIEILQGLQRDAQKTPKVP